MSDNVVDLSAYLDRSNKAILKSGGGGGTSDGMEARVSVLEAHIGHMREDIADIKGETRSLRPDMWSQFRWLLGILGGLIFALAGVVAKGFHWF